MLTDVSTCMSLAIICCLEVQLDGQTASHLIISVPNSSCQLKYVWKSNMEMLKIAGAAAAFVV